MRDERSPDAPGPASLDCRNASGLSRLTRLQFLGWFLLALYFVTSFVLIQGRDPVWGDELYPQSTGWSIANGRPAHMSVDGLYPRDIPLERFFGPVSFHVAATLIHFWGLRMLAWRAVCFLFGISLITAATALLLRLCAASQWVTLAGAAVALIANGYCIIAPGRWDPVTMGFVLAGFAFLLYAVNGSGARLAFLAVVGGIFFALAAGSTPRALPSLAGVACGLFSAACFDANRRNRILSAGAVAAFSGFVIDALLLAPLGMTPWSWLQTVRRLSKGDQIDTSPILGGEWNPQFSINKVVALVTLFLLSSGILCAWMQRRERAGELRTWRVALTIAALANLTLCAVFASRILSYAIFWLPLMVLASFSWIKWESLRGKSLRLLIGTLAILELLLPATLEIQRMYTSVELWRGRDPAVLLSEIRREIPRGSIVFGPIGGFFYPVEQAGSRYLYLGNDITPGLAVGDGSSAHLKRAVDAAACTAPTFAIWPGDGGNPILDVIPRDPRVEMSSDGVSGSNGLGIERLAAPSDCSSVQFDTSSIKPFGQP